MFYLSLVRQALIWPSVHNRCHLTNIKIAIVLKNILLFCGSKKSKFQFSFLVSQKMHFCLNGSAQCA
jgi:hypothetical protein